MEKDATTEKPRWPCRLCYGSVIRVREREPGCRGKPSRSLYAQLMEQGGEARLWMLCVCGTRQGILLPPRGLQIVK